MLLAQLAVLCTSTAGRAFTSRGFLAGTALAVSYGALAARAVPPERGSVIRCGRCGREYSGGASRVPGACPSCDRMAETEKKRVADALECLRAKLRGVEEDLRKATDKMEAAKRQVEESEKTLDSIEYQRRTAEGEMQRVEEDFKNINKSLTNRIIRADNLKNRLREIKEQIRGGSTGDLQYMKERIERTSE